MGLLKFMYLLITLELAVLVSSDSSSDLFYQLVTLNGKEKSSADIKISSQYQDTKTKLNNILNQNVVPSVNEVYKDVQNYINDLEDETSSSGYDASKCFESVRKVLASGEVPNIAEKAIKEMTNIYEVMHSNTLLIGTQNLDVISKEIDSITTEYVKCLASAEPQYCNRSFPNKFTAKLAELPVVYNKEVQRIGLSFIQEVANYENRAQDYVQEAKTTTTPYLSLLESCVAAIVVLGN